MKWFRNKSSEKQENRGAYEQLIRLAVEDYRNSRYATSIGHFRDAANVHELEEHHRILLDRAVRRWKMEPEETGSKDIGVPEMAAVGDS